MPKAFSIYKRICCIFPHQQTKVLYLSLYFCEIAVGLYSLLSQVGPDTELSTSELLTLSCGVLFFLSFFVAMYVEVKASDTIYQVNYLVVLFEKNFRK